MGTLKEDIKSQSDWIVEAFAADKLKLDYTIGSFIQLDIFMNKHVVNGKAKPGGRLANRLGSILFSISSYIGETIIKAVPGSVWITDDDAADGEVTITVQLPNGVLICSAQRVMKRFDNGNEDSLYVYGYELTKEFTNESFDEKYWDLIKDKPWWRFGF